MHHQMRHAGFAKQRPGAAIDRALVTDHQRRQHTRAAGIGHARRNALANPLPGRLDRVRTLRAQVQRRRVAWTVAQVAGGADAVVPEPAFAVKAVRVGQAVGLTQAHRQAPAIARAPDPAGPAAPEIAEQQARRQAHRLRTQCGRPDVELEAVAVGAALGHGCDLPGDHDVATFESWRQRLLRAVQRTQTGRSRGHQRTHQQAHHHRCHQRTSATAQNHPSKNCRRAQQPQVRRRRPQRRLTHCSATPSTVPGKAAHTGCVGSAPVGNAAWRKTC